VKAGDTILFGKFGGTDVLVDGEDLIILRESDVLGIIEAKAKAKAADKADDKAEKKETKKKAPAKAKAADKK